MKAYLTAALLAASLPLGAQAEDSSTPVQLEVVEIQNDSGAGEPGAGQSGAASGAWEKTRQTTERAWEATKEGASRAAEYTTDKAGQAWEATKEGTDRAVEWTKEKSKQAWDATKETADKAGDAVKRGYDKAKNKTREMVDQEGTMVAGMPAGQPGALVNCGGGFHHLPAPPDTPVWAARHQVTDQPLKRPI